jgi:hypothetical protein
LPQCTAFPLPVADIWSRDGCRLQHGSHMRSLQVEHRCRCLAMQRAVGSVITQKELIASWLCEEMTWQLSMEICRTASKQNASLCLQACKIDTPTGPGNCANAETSMCSGSRVLRVCTTMAHKISARNKSHYVQPLGSTAAAHKSVLVQPVRTRCHQQQTLGGGHLTA